MKSYSQLGEDIYCFQNFMNVPRKDVVLFEVGAYDGRTYSNTLALEEFNECKSVLIEPSPVNVRKIYANRSTASIHNVAIMSNSGVCEFVGDAAVSGIASELSDNYMEAWKLKESRRYKVLSVPLSTITEIENIEYIDFLSIDVQGAEFFVLSSMNWKIPMGVICIELEGQRLDYDEACRGILKGLGYEFKCKLHISEFWCNPNYYRSHLLFNPDNKITLDSFECLYFSDTWKTLLGSSFY